MAGVSESHLVAEVQSIVDGGTGEHYDSSPGVPKKVSRARTWDRAFARCAAVSFVAGRCARYVSSAMAVP